MKKKLIEKKDLLTAFKILEELRGSLDHIGAIEANQGKEAGKIALDEYFSSGVYKKIVAGVSALDKYICEQTYAGIVMHIKCYPLKKIKINKSK